MSGTRSPFPTALRTECPPVLIVAHGSPSAPAGPEADIRVLAAQTALRLPGWTLRGVTLAAGAAFDRLLEELSCSRVLIYPFFMSDGWFVREELPRRLRNHGIQAANILPPFGREPGVARLCEAAVTKTALMSGVPVQEMSVLLVGHGSETRRQPFQSVTQIARHLARSGKFREVRAGFLEGAPSVATAARLPPPAACVPLFTGRAGHVTEDLPRSLAGAGWSGALLEPLGLWPEVSEVIAGALRRYQMESRDPWRQDPRGTLLKA